MIQEMDNFFYIDEQFRAHDLEDFPDVSLADENGFLVAGGNFDPETLKRAYRNGIFPWPNSEADAIWWFSPQERFVLYPKDFHISSSLRRTIKKRPFEIRVDTAFTEVMKACAEIPRPAMEDDADAPKVVSSWIQPQMIRSYTKLNEEGIAHSIEAWQDGKLVGGLYGLTVGKIFCGESMFAKVDDASKVALAYFMAAAQSAGFELIDCQSYTKNFDRFGAVEIPQDDFIDQLKALRSKPVAWDAVVKGIQDELIFEKLDEYHHVSE